jgi:hypothetical protein
MCVPCQLTEKKVAIDIDDECLDCPEGIYPVIFNCKFRGAKDAASEFIESFGVRIKSIFQLPVPIYAGIGRATHERHREKTKVLDLSILVDFPEKIQPAGEVQNTLINGFPVNVLFKEAKHPNTTHACLHRLQWWAKVQPAKAKNQPEMAPTSTTEAEARRINRPPCRDDPNFQRRKRHRKRKQSTSEKLMKSVISKILYYSI